MVAEDVVVAVARAERLVGHYVCMCRFCKSSSTSTLITDEQLQQLMKS